MNDYYEAMDLLVYPRKSMRLTDLVTPMKPLEAMARRRLVLASDVGGHRELIDNNRTGLLFRPDDPTAIAETIASITRNRPLWKDIVEAGREYVVTQRRWDQSIVEYQRIYEQAIRSLRGSR